MAAAAAAPAANAATVACGSNCMGIAAEEWGLNDVATSQIWVNRTGVYPPYLPSPIPPRR
jgi:hypothetical protein